MCWGAMEASPLTSTVPSGVSSKAIAAPSTCLAGKNVSYEPRDWPATGGNSE